MKKQEIYLVLDNIRSGENVGSIFRTADAVGVSMVYLCGITPVPPHPKIAKAALGAEKYVPWEYHKQATRLVKKLKSQNSNQSTQDLECLAEHLPRKCSGQNSPDFVSRRGRDYKIEDPRFFSSDKIETKNREKIKIVALEQSPTSVNIFKFKPKFPLLLVVGNEVNGVNKKILSLADRIVEIPMYGKKESLNVAVATGIALYRIRVNTS